MKPKCTSLRSPAALTVVAGPAAGPLVAPRWRLALPDVNEELAVACHGSALCLAVDVNGRASASVDPAAAYPDWGTKVIDPQAVFTGVACPTTRVCIVVDGSGRMRIASVSNHPADETPPPTTH